MWLIDRTVLLMNFLVSPAILVPVLFLFETQRLLSSTKVSSFFVSGFDPSILLDAPVSIGDVMVESSFYGNDIDAENEESIPRQLYNYFFSSQQNPLQRTRRSANISPIKVNLSSANTASIDKKYGVAARNVFNTAKQAFAAAQNKVSSSFNTKQKRRHVKKIRPPPPPFISLGNQSYKLSHGTSQKLTSAIRSMQPQPPPPYFYTKHNFTDNDNSINASYKYKSNKPFYDLRKLTDSTYSDSLSNSTYSKHAFNGIENSETSFSGDDPISRNTDASNQTYSYSTYRPPSSFYGPRPQSAHGSFQDGGYLPYKYPYKYQQGRHPFTIPCETCEPYEENYSDELSRYQPYKDNRSKLPRFILPWPLTLYTKDLQRPFPSNTFLVATPTLIVPFLPFGLAELSLPLGWDANYVVERLNGFKKDVFGHEIADALPPVGPYQRQNKAQYYETSSRQRVRRSNFVEDQVDFLESIGDLLSNTLAINGKACVQRLICEISEVPVHQMSLMGEMLHHIIEPRKQDNEQKGNDDASNRDRLLLRDYTDAENQGKTKGECLKHYGMCPFSIRSLLPKEYVYQQIMANKIKRRV